MSVNTHLYSPWHNVECKFFPAKPTKKQVRKLRRKFIKDCKSC